jgi:hypothetical protein
MREKRKRVGVISERAVDPPGQGWRVGVEEEKGGKRRREGRREGGKEGRKEGRVKRNDKVRSG